MAPGVEGGHSTGPAEPPRWKVWVSNKVRRMASLPEPEFDASIAETVGATYRLDRWRVHRSDSLRPAPASLGSDVAPFSTLTGRRCREANGLLNWVQQAACKGKTGRFFSNHPGDVAGARKVCADCPVRSECFDFAMSDLNLHGVWAGLTAQERQKLRWGRVA